MFFLLLFLHLISSTLSSSYSSSSSSANLDGLNQWIVENNAASAASLRVAPGKYGLGVFAVDNVKSGDVLLRLPVMKSVLCQQTLEAQPGSFGALMRAAFKSTRDQGAPMALALYLLTAPASEGTGSIDDVHRSPLADHLRPWLEALPRETVGALGFTEAQLERLASVNAEAAQTARSTLRGAQQQLGRMRSLLAHDQRLSEHRWRWALSMVNSRAYHLMGVKILAPVGDFFNYAPAPQEYDIENYSFQQRGDLFAQHHKLTKPGKKSRVTPESELVVTADRDTAAGEELFETYGDNRNLIYLIYHGFVPLSNPFNCVPASVRCEAPDSELATLLGLPERGELCLRSVSHFSESQVSQQVIDILSVNPLNADSAHRLAEQVNEAGSTEVLFWRSKAPSLQDARRKMIEGRLVDVAREQTFDYDPEWPTDDLVTQYLRSQLAIIKSWTDPADKIQEELMKKVKQREEAQAAAAAANEKNKDEL